MHREEEWREKEAIRRMCLMEAVRRVPRWGDAYVITNAEVADGRGALADKNFDRFDGVDSRFPFWS